MSPNSPAQNNSNRPVGSPYVFERAGGRLTTPVVMLYQNARLKFDDGDFITARQTIAFHHATSNYGELSETDTEWTAAKARHDRSWKDCKKFASHVSSTPAESIRDVFLRAELLTMYFGGNQALELVEDSCPAMRMLGGLLQAAWKVGGAANV